MSGSLTTFAPGETPTATKLNAALAAAGVAGLSVPFIATGAAASRTAADRASDVFRLVDFVLPGDPDDTLALGRMIAAWQASPAGGVMLFPTKRETLLGVGANFVLNPAEYQAVSFSADGGREARLRFNPAFTGIAFTINCGVTPAPSEAPTIRLEGLEAISTCTGVAGQLFALIGPTGGQNAPSPGCAVEDIRMMCDGSGSWAQAGSFFAMNITRIKRVHCKGFGAGSIGLSYDTDLRLSVEHDIEDFYMNGGGTGLNLGHAGATGNLQGFTVRRGSFTGCQKGIVATCSFGIDQLLVGADTSFNCADTGISATNVTSLNVQGCYFLNNGTAMNLQGCARTTISGNQFKMGAATSSPGNGVNNLALVLNNFPGSSDTGCIVNGNIFTDNRGPPLGGNPPACININGFSNYVHCVGNFALQGDCISDTTGNPNNTDFGNYSHGSISGFALGAGALRTLFSVVAGNLNVSLPVNGNLNLSNGNFRATSPDGTTAIALAPTNTGQAVIFASELILSPRVGAGSDVPAVAFQTGAGPSYPTIQYSPTTNKFIFYSGGATPQTLASIDASGNLIVRGTVATGTP